MLDNLTSPVYDSTNGFGGGGGGGDGGGDGGGGEGEGGWDGDSASTALATLYHQPTERRFMGTFEQVRVWV